jgi:hypothetical protein
MGEAATCENSISYSYLKLYPISILLVVREEIEFGEVIIPCYLTRRLRERTLNSHGISTQIETMTGQGEKVTDQQKRCARQPRETVLVLGTEARYFGWRAEGRLGGNQLPSLTQGMRNRRKWAEATETVHFDAEVSGIPGGYTSKRIDLVMSDMIWGKVEYVRQYLDCSAESDIFLHGVEAWDVHYPDGLDPPRDDDANGFGSPNEDPNGEYVQTSGKTALHVAVCEMYPQVLNLLLQMGADPNATDVYGRVPLVEAALWGRLENVKVLLKYGAEKELESVRHGQRLRAIDFARPLQANAGERYNCSGSEHQDYKENTYERDLDRRASVRLLEDGAENPSQDGYSLGGIAFTKSPRDENLLTLVAHFDIPQKWKTIGVLYRGSQFYSVAAMSGWAGRP